MSDRAARKERTGVVTSDARDKTITIEVTASKRHTRYDKVMPSITRLHDFALLHGTAGDGVLDRGDDDVADVGVAAA